MKKITFFLTIVFLISACGVGSANAPTTKPLDVAAIQTSTYLTIVAGANQTATANAPTATPKPTNTPIPTPTNTPPPQPIILKGSGDNVVDVNKWDGIALIKATHNGQRNFIVHHFADSNDLGSIFNVIGNYSGTKLLDEKKDERTTRLQIKADGQWEFLILPLVGNVRIENAPSTFTGIGDDVIVIKGDNLDLLKSNYSGNSNFIIHAWSADGVDFLVNEIGPYTGTTIFKSNPILLEILTTGPWSIEITGK